MWSEKVDEKTGGSAFPFVDPSSERTSRTDYGMTLRDYFAGQVIVGLLTNKTTHDYDGEAAMAFEMADALIRARARNTAASR